MLTVLFVTLWATGILFFVRAEVRWRRLVRRMERRERIVVQTKVYDREHEEFELEACRALEERLRGVVR